jgi:MFS family permease
MELAAKKISSRAWPVVFVTYLVGFAVPANMAKVAALAPVLMPFFGIQEDMLGYIMGIFNALGIVLAFPTVSIIKKFGIRATVITSIACGVIGGVMGALASDYWVFLISRFFEGAGMGIMGVAGATAISPWFPKEKRGLPLAVWGLWVSTAMVICPTLYSFLVESVGLQFQMIWWGKVVFDVVVLGIFLLVYRDPSETFDDADVSDVFGEDEKEYKATDIFKSKPLIGLGILFIFCNAAFMGINNFLSVYLTGVVGTTLVTAGLINSWYAIIGAASAPISGKLSDMFKTRKWFILIGMLSGVVYSCIVFSITDEWIYWPLGIISCMAGAIGPTIVWSAVPETVPNKLLPNAMGWVAFTQNIGMTIGSMVLGNIVVAVGFTTSAIAMCAPLYALSAVVLLIFCWKKLR